MERSDILGDGMRMTGSEFSSWFFLKKTPPQKSLPRLKSQLNMVNADFKDYCPLRGPVREKLLSVSVVGNIRRRLLAICINEVGEKGRWGEKSEIHCSLQCHMLF
jgi:hypothetical protein